MKALQPVAFVPEGPQPLLRDIPRGSDYPTQALGPLKHVVTAVHATTQAPIAIAAQSALSVASLAVQAHGDVESLAGYVPTSLYCLTIAHSGERKSGCDRLVMQGLRHFERERASDYREAMTSWQAAHKLWTAKRDRMIKEAASGNKKKAADAEADLDALGVEPPQPLSPKVTTEEPTLEGLVKLYMVGSPSLGLFSDEGGGFLGGHAMNTDNRLKTVAGLSKLWGGDPVDRVRAGDGACTLFGRRLAVHLMAQPVAARPLLADPVASGQGFLARFLLTEPPSAIGTRLARSGNERDAAAISAAAAQLSALLERPTPCKDNQPQELEPRHLPLSENAKNLLMIYYEATEKAQANGGELEQVKSFASKSPEQAARIAGVLTLWGEINAPEVTAQVMADAIELAQFYLSEAKRLAETAAVSEGIAKADRLRIWLLESWPDTAQKHDRDPQTIVPRDVVINGPNAMRETEAVKKLMAVLENHGWLARLEQGAVVDGQNRNLAYRIVRPA